MRSNDTLLGPNPSGLCECGCGQQAPIATKTRSGIGHVKGQPVRFIAGHVARIQQSRPFTIEPAKYTIDPKTQCWNWNGSRNACGYAIVGFYGKCRLAHRLYYQLTYGPIADEASLDHLCRNRGCVNPDHVEPVPHVINARRGAQVKLSMEKARAIRALRGAMPASAVASRFGVCAATVSHIWTNRIWRE